MTNMDNVVALTGHDDWSEFRVSFIGLYYDGPYGSLFDPKDTSKTDDFIYEMDAAADLYLSIMASISSEPLVWLSSRIDLFLCGHDSFFALQERYGWNLEMLNWSFMSCGYENEQNNAW